MSEPLPPELADLVAAERAAPGADLAARGSVRTAIAAKVGAAPLGAPASGLGALGKTLAILAVTVGAGTAAVVYRGSSDAGAHVAAARVEHATEVHASAPPAPIDTTTPPAPRTGMPVVERTQAATNADKVVAARAVARIQTGTASPAAPSEPASNAPRASEPAPSEPAPSVSRTSEPAPSAPPQADLLRRATAALAAGDAVTALELARRDRELHLDGMLAEERDALEIRALARLGRDADAHTSALQFFTRYPASVHRAVLERALRPQPRTHGEP